MLEVLVAILVLSVGLFAMLGLTMNSMKLTATSNYRAMATQHAESMSNHLRSNAPKFFGYDNPDVKAVSTCFSSGCLPADILSTEMQMWMDQLADGLPKGTGSVCRSKTMGGDPDDWKCDGTTADPWIVKVCWDESRLGLNAKPGETYWECIYTQQ